MYRNLLNKKFFNENPFKELSAQQIVYTTIDMPKLDEMAREIVIGTTDRAKDEADILINLTDPDAILKLMRGKCDCLNYGILHQKVLEFEEELLPKIIKMLVTNLNDVLIEHATRIIPRCKKNYSKELFEILDDIRSPYALSYVCIALGFIANEDAIPILYDKYFELKKTYVDEDENYEQGPLFALYKLSERFYKR